MACECLSVLEKSFIKDNPEKKNARIYRTIAMDRNMSDSRPLMQVLYQKPTKDGDVTKKVFEIPLIPTYCPFCGVKYE
jgi:hypothetical protein